MMMRKFLLLIAVSIFVALPAFSQSSTGTVTTAEKPKKSAVFRPTKEQITKVQGILATKGMYSGEASGKYNNDTRSGIKSFQKNNGLKETGTLNRATLEKFGVELTESQKLIPVSESSYETKISEKPAKIEKISDKSTEASDNPKKAAPFRATKEQVIEAQKMLKSKSMYSGEETGKLDDATRDGLKKFQEAGQMKVTGTLNALTLEKMGIALTDSQKAAATASTSTPKK